MVTELVAFDAWHVTIVGAHHWVFKTLVIVLQGNLFIEILKAAVDALKLASNTSLTLVQVKVPSWYILSTLQWAFYVHTPTLSFHLTQSKMIIQLPECPNPPTTISLTRHGTEYFQRFCSFLHLRVLPDRKTFLLALWAWPFDFLNAADTVITKVVLATAGRAGIRQELMTQTAKVLLRHRFCKFNTHKR